MSIANAWCFTFAKARVTRIATLLCHRNCWTFYVTTGSGGNPRRICFPVTTANGANISQVPQQTARTTDQFKNGVLRGLRSACGNPEKGVSAFAAPQLGNPPIGAWDGPENDSDAARSLRFGSNDNLSPSFTTSSAVH